MVLNGCLVPDGASSRGSDDGYVGTPQAALIRRKSSTIGVGRTDYIQFPLPPNRTGSSPVYGSPFRGVPLATITEQVDINLAVLKVWLTVSPVDVS